MIKTLFIVAVISAGAYLASQTDSAQAMIERYMPMQKIDQAAEQLMLQVDSRIQGFADKQAEKQQNKITELEQRIAELEQQVLAANKGTEQSSSLELAQSNVPQQQDDELPQVQAYEEFIIQPVGMLHTQKQASLQDIASRMEWVSVQALNAQ